MGVPAVLHPWIAVGTMATVFITLQLRKGAPTDLLFLGGLLVVTLSGILTPQEAFSGFSNSAVLTIGALLAVAAGLRSSGVVDWVAQKLLGNVHDERSALLRLTGALVTTSAGILNTVLVAMMMPVVLDWCRRRNVSPSRLMMPLSHLVILGGVCTLIGTSTTLVVNGLLRDTHDKRHAADVEFAASASNSGAATAADGDSARTEAARRERFTSQIAPLGFFEIGYVGMPCAAIGAVVVLLFYPRLLPNRTDMLEQLGEQLREYLVEMMVQPHCPLVGRTVEQAGLRRLPGLFLIEISRDGENITPVAPQDVIHADDRLIFTGIVSTIVDLEKIPGLVPAADLTYEFHPKARHQRRLTEVVLSRTSPLIGATVREGNFRERYSAAVVAVHRNGQRVTTKIGDIALEPGDTLLLQTRNEFVSMHRNSPDFFLVSAVEGSEPRQHHKAALAAVLGVGLIVWLGMSGWLNFLGAPAALSSPPVAAITIAGLMIALGCLRVSEARGAIDLQVLITVAAAIGMGLSLSKSGAAETIARYIVEAIGDHPYGLLIAIYAITLVSTEMISNTAVAAMMLPIAIEVAWKGDLSPRPFILAIAVAASLTFLTPIGYQTNLMVMGPGGYKPSDYLRCGAPLAIAVAVTALFLIPRLWAF